MPTYVPSAWPQLGNLQVYLTTQFNNIAAALKGITQLGTVVTGVWNATIIALKYGGTASDLSATGGAHQVLQQSGAGAAVTVGQLAFTDISGSITAAQLPSNPLAVANGGTGAATFTTNGVLYGNTTSAVQVTAQGAANTVLTANAGAPAFSASPTIGTSVTCPLHIGGSGTTGTQLTLQTTTGNGTTDAIAFKGGNNGATTLATLTDGSGYSSALAILHTSTGGVGYATGAGGTVTQATSKSTPVTLSKICGAITMNAAALAASTSVGFTVTNTLVAATDLVILNIASGGTVVSYQASIDAVAAGSFKVQLRNVGAGSLSEAVVLNFAVIKAVTA